MKVMEYCFTDYYHQYMTIEADALTDVCKETVQVREDDCYALCSAFVGWDGMASFRILAIGPSWEECTRGMELKEILGILTADQVMDCEARLVEPDYEMIEKNRFYLEADEKNCDDDLEETRHDSRLDDLRDPWYPDRVAVGIVSSQMLYEYAMQITGVKGPFLTGILDEEPSEEIGVHMDDQIYALPYIGDGEFSLFALFAGSEMNEVQQEAIDKIISETNRMGIDFNGVSIKN